MSSGYYWLCEIRYYGVGVLIEQFGKEIQTCVHCNWVDLVEFLSCCFCLLHHEVSGNCGWLEAEKGKVLFS